MGFRPFVYRAAHAHCITGWVCNATEGVIIHGEGTPDDLDRFVMELSEQHPRAAVVKEIDLTEIPAEGFDAFEIRYSEHTEGAATTLVSPDLATCDECCRELFDEADRRYRYPFINCTNCGPRFTIIRSLPYDRPQTSMAEFTMCEKCATEYADPLDRRFHAQPDACFTCGPHLGWYEADTSHSDGPRVGGEVDTDVIEWAHDRVSSDALLEKAVKALRAGRIVAVKGLGGYHLACDANNPQAIAELRRRKKREGKAFAVMVVDEHEARRVCFVDDAEGRQLLSPARPIVLLRKRPEAVFADGLANDLGELGVMLPATPVQHLLTHDFGGMLVMTSGNLHDEPIVTEEAQAFSRLRGVADAFLVNDRAIESRYDDSVVRVLDGGAAGPVVQVIRRARGFAPVPVALPVPADADVADLPCILATGPEQKNTFTLTRGAEAFVSQHIGDMENADTFDAWLSTVKTYEHLFRVKPSVIARDHHPEYLTSKWAERQDVKSIAVQHHHAHVLSVMGENALEGPVCGIAFDGTGYGLDGAIWGGEVLLSNLQAFERFANFAYVPLPGGAAAIKHPRRCAYGALWAYDLLDHPAARAFVEDWKDQASLCDAMIEKGINTPMTSSVGRLFDAASALMGVCDQPRYEGEAAVLLEALLNRDLAQRGIAPSDIRTGEVEAYPIEIIKNTATETSTAQDTSVVLLDPAPAFAALLDDCAAEVALPVRAQRFHEAFVSAVLQVAEAVRALYGIDIVTLSGGVFMNRYLIQRCLAELQQRGFTVALNRDLPPNDASVSYGQAVLALHS